MPRRKDVNEWKTDSRGRYRRMIGWKGEGGKRVQQPFYLGTDLDQAKARYIRVKELWAHLERSHELTSPALNSRFDRPEPIPCLWDGEALWVARALAGGSVQVVVPLPGGVDGTSYVSMIDRLAKRFPMVHFVPEEAEAYEVGKAAWSPYVEDLQKRIPVPLPNIAAKPSASFHQAISKYIEHIEKSALEPSPDGPRMTAFGHVKVEQANRIKSRQKDRPLSSLDLQGCQELLDYWRMRPLTEATKRKPDRPMEVRYCENHIAELSRFFRWLHKTKLFDWRKPEDFDELETKVKDLPEERTNIDFLSVEVFTVEQLAILNKYATPLERLLLLLGLNCGFKGAEQGTLRFDHLFLDKPHPHAATIRERTGFDLSPEDRFVLYSRNKSEGVRRVPALAADGGRPPLGGRASAENLHQAAVRVVGAPADGSWRAVLPPHGKREEPEPDLHQQVGGAHESGTQGPPRLPPLQLHHAPGHRRRPHPPHRRWRGGSRLPHARQTGQEGRPPRPVHQSAFRRGLQSPAGI